VKSSVRGTYDNGLSRGKKSVPATYTFCEGLPGKGLGVVLEVPLAVIRQNRDQIPQSAIAGLPDLFKNCSFPDFLDVFGIRRCRLALPDFRIAGLCPFLSAKGF
jgi:hypothetical protein